MRPGAQAAPCVESINPAVKFIYIKATEKDRRIEWFAFAIAVRITASHADQDCGDGQRRNNCDSLLFARKNEKSLREELKPPVTRGSPGSPAARHDERCFVARLGFRTARFARKTTTKSASRKTP